MWFPYPIRPLAEIPATLAALPSPFFVHVREPEYAADDVLAKYLNRATVVPSDDFDLRSFRSYRVEAFAPAGPIPLEPVGTDPDVPDDFSPGFCRTTWVPGDAGSSVLMHPWMPLSAHFDVVLSDPNRKDVTTDHVEAIDLSERGPAVT
jgi:hypothetical protein